VIELKLFWPYKNFQINHRTNKEAKNTIECVGSQIFDAQADTCFLLHPMTQKWPIAGMINGLGCEKISPHILTKS
jgi:hypothetical protein